jgi:hypothetical protein
VCQRTLILGGLRLSSSDACSPTCSQVGRLLLKLPLRKGMRTDDAESHQSLIFRLNRWVSGWVAPAQGRAQVHSGWRAPPHGWATGLSRRF